MDPKKLSILWPPHTYHGMNAPSIYSYTIKKNLDPVSRWKVRLSSGGCPHRVTTFTYMNRSSHTAYRGAEREQEGEEENTKHRTARDWWGWPHRGQMHLVPERGKETRFMLWMLYHD